MDDMEGPEVPRALRVPTRVRCVEDCWRPRTCDR